MSCQSKSTTLKRENNLSMVFKRKEEFSVGLAMFQSSINSFQIAEFASGQDEANITMHSDWLPERARWGHLARSGFPALVPQAKVLQFSHIMNPLLTKLVQSSWLNIGPVFFFFFFFFFLRFYFPRRS